MSFRARLLCLALLPWLSLSACTLRLINVPGEDTGFSNVVNLNVTIEADSAFQQAQFRVVPASSPDANCNNNLASYSPLQPIGNQLISDISSVPDGEIRLCVRVKGIIMVAQGENPPQPTEVAKITSATWTKDTVPPGSFQITGPSGTQSINTPTISWAAAEGASSYDIDITSDAACENIYKTFPNVTGTSFQITDGIANGFWHVCIKAKDLASNKTPATNNGILMTVDAPFHYLFATSSVFTGSEIGGFDGADDQCTLHAFLGNLIPDWNGVDRTYKAVLSGSNLNAKNRFVLDRSIFNRNNQLVTLGNAIWTPPFAQPIQYDENASPLGAAPVWSGTKADGNSSGNSCSDWTSNSGLGTSGFADANNSAWIYDQDAACSAAKHLYCIGPFAN